MDCPTVSPPASGDAAQLEPFPAVVHERRYDILAYNRAYGGLLGDLDALPPRGPQLLWLAFTHPDWGAADASTARRCIRLMVAQFRAAMAEHVAEPAWKALLKRLLRASPSSASCGAARGGARRRAVEALPATPGSELLHLSYTTHVARSRSTAARTGDRLHARSTRRHRRAGALERRLAGPSGDHRHGAPRSACDAAPAG